MYRVYLHQAGMGKSSKKLEKHTIILVFEKLLN